MTETTAIILAAGISSRMNTKMAKVLHEVCGRPMLAYVLDACRQAGIKKMYVVVGFSSEQVKEKFADADDIVWIRQEKQLGTGHAVLCCKDHLKDFQGQTLVLCGDGPLIRTQTLTKLIKEHEAGHSSATLATAVLEEPAGYGRIVRDKYGNIKGIVEDSDCTKEELEIREINPSYYLFNNKILFDTLANIQPDNVKGEYYLTDVISGILATDRKVLAIKAVMPEEALSINSRAQLSEVSKIMQQRIQRELMEHGVTIVDPDNTWIDARAKIGQDTIIEPFTYIHGQVVIGQNCRIGPFAYLRDGTVLNSNVILGVFTEIKNSVLGESVRARHHSYIGDTNVGRNVNIGAGSITANYDGQKVHKTSIGNNCHIGSGAILIAPLVIQDNSIVSAGTVVSQENVNQLGRKADSDVS
ncbi:MAG: NTP transferase domain-containing protein [Sedimentisphaerales bacterium]|nr:NTP transferase domain-containing protein [Sedimentisphaerales bacterium]